MEKIKVGAFIPLPVVPTVLVGANVEGKPNYLAVGFVSGVNIKPPIIGISLNRKHHTVKGILETGTFSINIPSAEFMRETDYCGLVSGRSVDKSSLFSTFYGELITAPMIEEFPIVCECAYTGQKVDFAMDTVFFGEIKQAYVNRDLYKKGQPADILRINPLLTGLDKQYRIAGDPIGKAFSIGWEYTNKQKKHSANIKDTSYAIVNRAPKNALYKNCELQNNGIGKAIEEIKKYADKLNATPIEGPFLLRNEGLEVESNSMVGFVFKTKIRGKGDIKAGKITGGRFAHCAYIGPYEKIDKALSSLFEYIDETGFKGTGLIYEFYLNDPNVTSPDKLETSILIPIKRKK